MMKNGKLRFISMLIAVVFLVQSMPMQVLAANTDLENRALADEEEAILTDVADSDLQEESLSGEDILSATEDDEETILTDAGNNVTLSFPNKSHFQIYKATDIKQKFEKSSKELINSSSISVAINESTTPAVYIKADEGYTISSISTNTIDVKRLSVKSLVDRSYDDYSCYRINLNYSNLKSPFGSTKISVYPNIVPKANNSVKIIADENTSDIAIGKLDSDGNIDECPYDGTKYTTNNYTSYDVLAASKPGYAPKLYINEDEYSCDVTDGISPFLVPKDTNPDAYAPKLDFNISRVQANENEVYIKSFPTKNVSFNIPDDMQVNIIGESEIEYDPEGGIGFSRDTDAEEIYIGSLLRNQYIRKTYANQKLYFAVGNYIDPEIDIYDYNYINNRFTTFVVKISGETLEPVSVGETSSIYCIDMTKDMEISIEEVPARIPLEYNPEDVESFSSDANHPYTELEPGKGVIEYTDRSEATFTFKLKPGRTLEAVYGESYINNDPTDDKFSFKITSVTEENGVYTVKRTLPNHYDEINCDYSSRIIKLRIETGSPAEIKFEKDIRFIYCDYEEYTDTPVYDTDDVRPFNYTQTHVIGEVFYVALQAPSKDFALAAINAAGEVKDLECIENYQYKSGEVYQVYKINVSEPVTIGNKNNLKGDPKKVIITDNFSLLECSDVVLNNAVKNADGTYTVKKDGKLSFSVLNKTGNYAPKVKVTSYSGMEDVIPNIEVLDDGSVRYDYAFSYSDIFANTEITLEETKEEKLITFEYPTSAVKKLTVRAAGQTIEPVKSTEKDGITTAEYKSMYGAKMTYTVETTDTYLVGTVETKQGAKDPLKVTRNAATYSGEFYATYDTKVAISPSGKFNARLEVKVGETWNVIDPDSQTASGTSIKYSLFRGNEYRFSAFLGDKPINSSAVKIPDSQRYANSYKVDNSKSPVSIVVPTPAFGTKLPSSETVVGNVEYPASTLGDKTKVLKAKINFNIYNSPGELRTSKILTGTNNDKYEATIDLTNGLTFRRTTSLSLYGAEINYLNEDYKSTVDIQLNPSKGLVVTPDPSAPIGDVAKVKFYRKDRLSTDSDYYVDLINERSGTSVKELTVSVCEPKNLIDSTVELKLDKNGNIESDDTTITLDVNKNVTVYETIRYPKVGAQYYEIKAVPEDKASRPAQITEKTIYIPRDYISEEEWFDGQYNEQYEKYEQKCEKLPEDAEWPEFVPVYKDITQKLRAKISGFDEFFGQEWNYDICISLVQTKSKDSINATNAASLINYRSKPLTIKASTKNPSYETNLAFAKKASRLYVGQSQAEVATLKFSATTVCKGATARDITECSDDDKLDVYVEDGILYANVSPDTALGTHTIEVTPAGPASMYKLEKTLTVSVVKGIEKIDVVTPATSIYKQGGKQVTFNASVVLNAGTAAPQSKNVNWKVVTSYPELDGELDLGDESVEGVTIKNGKVTVGKDISETSFYIVATANDYAGNKTYGISEQINVSGTKKDIHAIKLLKYDEARGVFTVLSSENNEYTTKQLENAYIAVFGSLENTPNDSGVIDRETLKDTMLKTSDYKLTIGNKKALSAELTDAGYKLTPANVAKNIAITAQTTDGGKVKKTEKITIVYSEPADLRINAFVSANSIIDDTNDWSFFGTINTPIELHVEEQKTENATWTDVDSMTAHSVKVAGGKILKSDVKAGKYTIIVTGEKATVTFSDNLKRSKKIYTITNSAYSKNAAPKIKVENTIVSGSTSGRKADITIKPQYDVTGKSVMVELNAIQAYAVKTAESYAAFEMSSAEIGKLMDASEKLTLNFDETSLKAGKYNVVLTFGTKNAEGKLIADAKPVTAVVTVAAPKQQKGNFIVTKSLKGTVANPDEFIITASQKNVHSVSYNGIVNANINGKPNDFTKYFELKSEAVDGGVVYKICLKATLTEAEKSYIRSKEGKNDRICYISYTYRHGNNGYGVPFETTKTTKTEMKY